jgi:adenine-specific DNA glycosylase
MRLRSSFCHATSGSRSLAKRKVMESKTNTDKVKSIVNLMIPWYQKNARDLPWRRKPYCDDPYCVYVSEIMISETQTA